jgi:fibronectin type 3 domain-containing protein
VFPPSAPTGLAAIPGGGFGQPASIDLSWEPNSESDLLGYNVYRAEAPVSGASASFTRLNPEPIPGTAFRDLNAQPSHSYLYRITAIDQHHNESAPSPVLTEQLHP